MAISVNNETKFNEWLNFSLSWTVAHTMKSSALFLKGIELEKMHSTMVGDSPSMYPEVQAAYWMSVFGLENDEVFEIVMKKTGIQKVNPQKRRYEKNNEVSDLAINGNAYSKCSLHRSCSDFSDMICDTYCYEKLPCEAKKILLENFLYDGTNKNGISLTESISCSQAISNSSFLVFSDLVYKIIHHEGISAETIETQIKNLLLKYPRDSIFLMRLNLMQKNW